MLRLYGLLALILAIITGGYFSYKYISDLQSSNKNLTALVSTQEISLDIANKSIEKLQNDLEEYERLNRELNERISSAERYIDELRETLSEHDLEYLALIKPGLIERIINNATDEVLDAIERITRSE